MLGNIKKINFERQNFIVDLLKKDLPLSNIITTFVKHGKVTNSHPNYKIRTSIYSDDLVFYPDPDDELTYFTFSRRLGGKDNINAPRLDVSYHQNNVEDDAPSSSLEVDPTFGTIVINTELTTQQAATSFYLNDEITLKPVTSKGHTRILKKSNGKRDAQLTREYEINKSFAHLKQKHIRHDTNGSPYLTIRNLGYITLQNILDDDKNGNAILSTKERFQLSIAILKAYAEQVLTTDYIHLDLKPENILVKKTPSGFIVNIIDFGLAHEIGTKISDVVTVGYKAPELLTLIEEKNYWGDIKYSSAIPNNKASEALDCYPLGLMISQIFGDHDISLKLTLIYILNQHQILNNHQYTSNALWHKNSNDFGNNLFSGMYNIPKDIKNDLALIIKSMMDHSPEKRISIENALKGLTNTYIKWKAIKTSNVDTPTDEQELDIIKNKLHNLEVVIDLFKDIESDKINELINCKQKIELAIKKNMANKMIVINHFSMKAKCYILMLLKENQKSILNAQIAKTDSPEILNKHISLLKPNKSSPLFSDFISNLLEDKLIQSSDINKKIKNIIDNINLASNIKTKLEDIDECFNPIKLLFQKEFLYINEMPSSSFDDLDIKVQDMNTAFEELLKIKKNTAKLRKANIREMVQQIDVSSLSTLSEKLSEFKKQFSQVVGDPKLTPSRFGFLSNSTEQQNTGKCLAMTISYLPKY